MCWSVSITFVDNRLDSKFGKHRHRPVMYLISFYHLVFQYLQRIVVAFSTFIESILTFYYIFTTSD